MRTGATGNLQDLRRKIYLAAKADKKKRFWGMYGHLTKTEVLNEAYRIAKKNKGSEGIDGMSFEEIEATGVDRFIQGIKEELENGTYRPKKSRKVEIPKESGKTRTLGIPTIKDRVVQGAMKLLLEAIFEADFTEGSYGYRPAKSQHQAVTRVSQGIMRRFTKVIDVDLTAFFDNVKHGVLLEKIAKRINDPNIMKVLKQILKAGGNKGIAQGGPLSPLLSNIYLNEIDHMFERAKTETERNGYQQLDYCRFSDDIVIIINGHPALEWLVRKSLRRLKEELSRIGVTLNTEKTKIVDMEKGGMFSYLGFDYRMVALKGSKMVLIRPRKKKIQGLIEKVRSKLSTKESRPFHIVIKELNEVLVGWVNYYRIGHCSKLFSAIRQWVEQKVRRFVRKRQKLRGFGWKEWSKEIVYGKWGLFDDYGIRYYKLKANPGQ